jgi:diguanylate cyclase (GGDEF)-like protein/PAS domain S-box-containing protein
MQLEEVFNHAAIGIACVGIDGACLSVNSKLCQIVGYSTDELHQLTLHDITHPDDREPELLLVNQMIAGASNEYRLEKRYFHKNGSIIWINTTVSLVKGARNSPAYFITVVEDITDRKNVQFKWQKEMRFFERAVNSSLAGIYIYNINQGKNEFISMAYTDITGYTIDDINQFSPEEFAQLFHEDDVDSVFKHIDKIINALDESYSEVEYRFKKKAGGWVWCLSRDKVFSWDENNRAESFIGTFVDITRIKNLELELKDQARLDYLTGVDNRRSLNEKLNHEFNRSQRYKRSFSLLMIDIDNFKEINDTYGHNIGDDILVHLARQIKQIARDSDTTARYGGDEFIVILPEVGREQALMMAERIRDEFGASSSEFFKQNGQKPTISVGVSTLDENLSSSADLMKAADVALYQAKAAGRNNVK